jgi:hypothetical protein
LSTAKSIKSELFLLELEANQDVGDEQHWKVLNLLLNSKITTFHYPPSLDLVSQTAASALWQSLVEARPPDLHTIVCRCLGRDGNCNVRPIFNSLLSAFTGLEELRLKRFVATNADLCNIADCLPNLR